MPSTREHLEEMRKRVDSATVPAPTSDRYLGETRQQQIVEGASRVLFEKGFCKASIRDIASACGMSMGQLYHYISSKEDILYLIHLHSHQIWLKHLEDAGLDKIVDPVAKFEHALRTTIIHMWENRELYRFIFTERKYMGRERLGQLLDLEVENVVGFYRHLLSLVVERELEGRETDVAANLVSYICLFPATRGPSLELRRLSDLEATVESLVEFTVRGLGIARGEGNRE